MQKVVRSVFGNQYRIITNSDGIFPGFTQALFFQDLTTAMSFIRSLDVPEGFWRQLYFQTNHQSAFIVVDYQLLEEIGSMMLSGKILFVEVTHVETNTVAKGKRRFSKNDGNSYQFEPAEALLLEPIREQKYFCSAMEVKDFINGLGLERSQLEDVISQLNLGTEPLECSAFSEDQLVDQLADAVIEKRCVIAVEKVSNKAPEGGSSNAGECSADTPGNRSTELAPAAPAENNPDKVEDHVCELSKMVVSCSHDGRKVEVTPDTVGTLEFDVVASEKSQRGFDKVKAVLTTNAPCGIHTTSSSTISPAPAKTEKGSLENTYHLACEPVTNPLNVLWLPSIKPKAYKIGASACNKFTPSSVIVNVYPKLKWSANIAYSFGGKESKKEKNEKGISEIEHSNKGGKFSGKLELAYDEEKRNLTGEYKTGIDEVLKKLGWIRDKVDRLLQKLSDDTPVKLEVFWPNLGITYEAEIQEDTGPEVVSTYNLAVSADPLIGLKGSVDIFPVLLKAAKSNPAAASIAKILEEAMKGIGSDKSLASIKADLQLVFSIESKIIIKFSTAGKNGVDDKEVKSEQGIDMAFQLEGVVGVKGHVWIIKFEKSYKAGIKTGFIGKVVVTRDDVGYYWYSRFLFNGLIVYFTKYEKLEKSVTGNNRLKNKLLKVPDQVEDASTTEWVWIEPDPDEEAPADTNTAAGSAQTQASNRHYIIKF